MLWSALTRQTVRVAVPASWRAAPAASRALTGGSEPIKGMDPRTAGAKGMGDKPYEVKKIRQDGPPPGGFPPINTERKPNTTPNIPSSVILGLTALMMGYGFYALKQEKWFIRTNLVPLLQAEEDVAYLERQKKKLAKEAEIMKDVKGWEVGASVYHSKKWMPMPMNSMYFPGRFGPAENDQ